MGIDRREKGGLQNRRTGKTPVPITWKDCCVSSRHPAKINNNTEEERAYSSQLLSGERIFHFSGLTLARCGGGGSPVSRRKKAVAWIRSRGKKGAFQVSDEGKRKEGSAGGENEQRLPDKSLMGKRGEDPTKGVAASIPRGLFSL